MASIQPPPQEQLIGLLDEAIRQEIERVISTEIDQARDRVEKSVRGAVGAIAAKVLSNFSFERMGQDLVIRVQFAFPESKPGMSAIPESERR
jgi:hypothetical protein